MQQKITASLTKHRATVLLFIYSMSPDVAWYGVVWCHVQRHDAITSHTGWHLMLHFLCILNECTGSGIGVSVEVMFVRSLSGRCTFHFHEQGYSGALHWQGSGQFESVIYLRVWNAPVKAVGHYGALLLTSTHILSSMSVS